jgi:PAS domain S-box-containing protein
MNSSSIDAYWVVDWSTDDGGRCDSIDLHWQEITGQTADAAKGGGWLETIHPDDRDQAKNELREARRSERSFQFAARIRRVDLQFRWAMALGAPRRDEQGAFLGFSGSLVDFHDRMTAERELAEASLRQRAAFASLSEAVFIADAEGWLTDFNGEFIRYHRFKHSSECGRHTTDYAQYLDVWLSDGRPAPPEQWAIPRALRGETGSNVALRLARKDTGETWWGSYNFSPIKDETGKITGAVVAAREISALKEAEKRLRDSEALLTAEAAALLRLNAASARLWQTSDLNQGLEEMLAATIELLGADKGNVQLLDAEGGVLRIASQRGFNRDFLEFFREVSSKESTACGRALQSGERSVIEDIEVDAEYASYRPIARAADYRAVQSTPLLGRDGARLGMLSTHWRLPHRPSEQDLRRLDLYARQAADFIEHCRMANALRDSEALLQAVIDGSPDAIFLKDREGRMRLANPVTLAAIGKPAEFCAGKTDEEFLLNPEDARAVMAHDRRVMESARTEIYDETLVTPYGTRCFRNHKTPYRDAAGKVIGLIGVARDITAQIAAEAALRESEERFRVLTHAIPSLLWETDAEGLTTFMSDAWCSYTGMSAADVAGIGWTEALHPEDRKRIYREWMAAVASPEPFECRYRLRAADGSYRWFLTRSAPLRDPDGCVRRWVGSSTEIDEIVQAQAALAAADRRKNEFLATLAHELRNPLSPIRNAVHVLKRKQTSENSDATLLAMMDRQVNHLVRLVDELLEISRISRGQIELRKESVVVSDFLQHALETCHPLIEKHGHRVSVKLADGPLWVFGDPLRLCQIAANIINNAAKYTPPGGLIEIEAARESGELTLRVRDNGVGVSAEMMPRIFDMFVRADGQARRSEGGLGIGLALARQLVLLHGGRIEAASNGAGKGSEFVVRMPLQQNPAVVAKPIEREARDDVKTARVLVIDDDHDVADSFGMLLETMGATVRTAYDGPAGVAAIDAFEPDLIFVDIGMPEVDGYETARRMRSSHHKRRFLLVALTGWGQKEDRSRAQDAGFDLHLTKPAPIEAVKELLARVGSPGGAGVTP